MGYNVDYLTPTVYLTDLLALVIIFFGRNEIKILLRSRGLFYIFLFLFLILLNISRTDFAIYSIYKWLRIVVVFLVGVVLVKNSRYDFFKNFVKPLSYSVFIVNVIAILQFFKKGSLGGIFYFLGERNFRFIDPNISPYPYSTFSHPNSLAGFLAAFLFFVLTYQSKFDKKWFLTSIVLSIIVILLSGSLAAMISLVVVYVLYLIKNKKKLFVLNKLPMFVFLTDRSISHRIELLTASFKMWFDNLLLGVGLNGFVSEYPNYSSKFISLWELQPVHNIFLLVAAETGIIGMSVFLYLIYLVISTGINFPLMVVLITGMVDHYWLTLEQNIYLLIFVVVFSLRKELIKPQKFDC